MSDNIAMLPDTWNPPMQTGKPAARNGRARSTARGNYGLYADQTDKCFTASFANCSHHCGRSHTSIGFVMEMQADLDISSQHLALLSILGQPGQTRERVGGYYRSYPLDGIAVIVIMSRLDQHQVK
jgi:hypothetical protein